MVKKLKIFSKNTNRTRMFDIFRQSQFDIVGNNVVIVALFYGSRVCRWKTIGICDVIKICFSKFRLRKMGSRPMRFIKAVGKKIERHIRKVFQSPKKRWVLGSKICILTGVVGPEVTIECKGPPDAKIKKRKLWNRKPPKVFLMGLYYASKTTAPSAPIPYAECWCRLNECEWVLDRTRRKMNIRVTWSTCPEAQGLERFSRRGKNWNEILQQNSTSSAAVIWSSNFSQFSSKLLVPSYNRNEQLIDEWMK